jgi:crotonobetainyl-CoA:carnitine CoA-transferase CaiB-like acyl-CoA transferase
MGTFKASDGYFNIGASGTNQYRALCEVLGRLDLRDEPRYQKNPERLKDRDHLNAELNKGFATQTTAHWVQALNDAGVPCGPINTIDQVFDDPQVKHRGLKIEMPHPLAGIVPLVASPMRLSGTPVAYESPPPTLGQDTEEVLTRLLKLDAAAIAALREKAVI